MEIKFLGHACFRLKGKKAIVVTDPYDEQTGLKMRRVSADIVTVSHDHHDHNNVEAVSKTSRREPFIINAPGEYEVAGVFVMGLSTFHDQKKGAERGKNVVYVITLDQIRLVHLGDLGHLLTDKQLEEINGADVLFVPVGGIYTLGPKKAAQVVAQIEPKIIIPMHYQVKGLKIKQLKGVEAFLKEMEVEARPVAKLNLTKDQLPEEKKVVVFKS